jgi:uncharacterized protein (DUF1697 family)
VALIRGVNNIGASRRIAMADLRKLFEGLGYLHVCTLLNSGNVVFTAPGRMRREIRARIEEGIARKLGLTVQVTLLSAQEVACVVAENPFTRAAAKHSDLLVVVPRMQSDKRRLRPLLAMRWTPEALKVGRRVAYLWCANGVPRSPIWAAVERALGRTGTARNVATMTKLSLLLRGPGESSR